MLRTSRAQIIFMQPTLSEISEDGRWDLHKHLYVIRKLLAKRGNVEPTNESLQIRQHWYMLG
jgi:hypothetical protein